MGLVIGKASYRKKFQKWLRFCGQLFFALHIRLLSVNWLSNERPKHSMVIK